MAEQADRLASFNGAKNYALYYGPGREGDLAQFDLAIVEPAGQSQSSLRAMQLSGTLVLAYLSVMEVPPWDPVLSILRPEDFLSQGGRPLCNQAFGNYLADLRSSRWAGLLLHRAGSLLDRWGYDGLFLDTIGDVEDPGLPGGLADSLLLAAAELVGGIRKLFPGRILVQNNGLERLCLLTAEMINGLCWENPPLADQSCRPWSGSIITRLESLKKKHGLKIMLLVEDGETSEPSCGTNCLLSGRLAVEKGFLFYRAYRGYTGGVYCLKR